MTTNSSNLYLMVSQFILLGFLYININLKNKFPDD